MDLIGSLLGISLWYSSGANYSDLFFCVDQVDSYSRDKVKPFKLWLGG